MQRICIATCLTSVALANLDHSSQSYCSYTADLKTEVKKQNVTVVIF